MKARLVASLKKAGLILALGVLYYFVFSRYHIAIPCLYKLSTGLLCPACGITRMISSMIQLDFAAAYGYNKALFLTWPVIAGVFVVEEIKYIRRGERKMYPASRVILSVEIIFLLLFAIVRNIRSC